ncbi:hypothetical protein LLH00_01600 [bacterium]|nr:hypothetical protein [bacterium]
MSSLNASKTRIPPDTFNRVAYNGERVEIHHRSGASLFLISAEDMELLETAEDLLDLQAVHKALEEMKAKGESPLAWDEAKKRLGL